jgi:DNA-binding MarR family transcriptional regulator
MVVEHNLHQHTETADELHGLFMELVRVSGMLREGGSGPLSFSEAFALHELDGTEAPLSQLELAQRLGLDKSTVSRIAAGLEAKGLVTRERDPSNRRYYRLRVTDAGRGQHRHMGKDSNRWFESVVARLTTEERAALFAGLPAFIRAVRTVESFPA